VQIKLRVYKESDAENLVLHGNNFEVAKFMADRFPYPYTIYNAKEFIQLALSHTPTRMFAVDLNGECIGGAGVHLMDDIFVKNAELGYWLGQEHWGKGYGAQILHQLSTYAFGSFPIDRLFCRVFGNNIRSLKLVEKAGFVQEAHFVKTLWKNNEALDEYIYGLRRSV